MSLLDKATANSDKADLIILSNVETIRDQGEPATASAVAALIGGAPVREIDRRLRKLVYYGCLEADPSNNPNYYVSELGAELLRRELVGWSPSKREDRRREAALLYRSSQRLRQ